MTMAVDDNFYRTLLMNLQKLFFIAGRIDNRPKLRDKQGMYSVIGMDGRILKRGHDLKTVLRVLERKLIRAVD